MWARLGPQTPESTHAAQGGPPSLLPTEAAPSLAGGGSQLVNAFKKLGNWLCCLLLMTRVSPYSSPARLCCTLLKDHRRSRAEQMISAKNLKKLSVICVSTGSLDHAKVSSEVAAEQLCKWFASHLSHASIRKPKYGAMQHLSPRTIDSPSSQCRFRHTAQR